MGAKIDRPSESTVRLDTDDIRRRMGATAKAADLAINEEKLVYGGAHRGLAAFAPVNGLEKRTAEEFASGTQVGVVLLSDAQFSTTGKTDETDEPVPPGVYVMTAKVAPGALKGTSQLLDDSGRVVASAPLHVIEKNLHELDRKSGSDSKAESFKVGGVTVEVGWLYVCFDWDDPPGSGGMCHHVCYGWQ